MRTRAKWAEGIPDLYHRLDDATALLTVEQVSDRIGQSVTTITDLLSRAVITHPDNPLRHISRPKFRVGNRPLYTSEQVDQVVAAMAVVADRPRVLGGAELPSITAEEADERGLVSVMEVSAEYDIHPQALRRWARDDQTFPPAVANRRRRAGHPGVPEVVRDATAMRKWLTDNGKITAP